LEFNVPFQHKYGHIRDERSGVESHLYPVKDGQRYINFLHGRLFVQQPPNKGKAQEAHLNYYASAYNRELVSWSLTSLFSKNMAISETNLQQGRETEISHRKTKLNQIQQKQACTL